MRERPTSRVEQSTFGRTALDILRGTLSGLSRHYIISHDRNKSDAAQNNKNWNVSHSFVRFCGSYTLSETARCVRTEPEEPSARIKYLVAVSNAVKRHFERSHSAETKQDIHLDFCHYSRLSIYDFKLNSISELSDLHWMQMIRPRSSGFER